jgi:DnaJ-class molecular chaperone
MPMAAVKPPAQARPAPAAPAPAGLDAAQLKDLEARWSRLDELDYYQLLKVEKSAAPADIKRAFYQESRTYHPDRFFHLKDTVLKEKVTDLFKRVTEAYFVLRDDTKRKKYVVDISGPDRAQKLRFTEASETETKQAVKKEQEEQIGTHPKGRQFYQTAMKEMEGERWASAERNLKMALTFEPQNARYKEKLNEAQQKVHEEFKKSGQSFKIK